MATHYPFEAMSQGPAIRSLHRALRRLEAFEDRRRVIIECAEMDLRRTLMEEEGEQWDDLESEQYQRLQEQQLEIELREAEERPREELADEETAARLPLILEEDEERNLLEYRRTLRLQGH